MLGRGDGWTRFWRHQDTFSDAFLRMNADVFIERSDRLLEPHPGDVVLDVGCGVGHVAAALASRVKTFDGVDVSDAAIAECRRRLRHVRQARFLVGDLAEGLLPTAPVEGGYTLVVAHSVFQYLDDQETARRVIDAIGRVMAPHARLLIADLPGDDRIGVDVASQVWHGIARGRALHVATSVLRAGAGPYRTLERSVGLLRFTDAELLRLGQRLGGEARLVRSLTANASRRNLFVRT